jgi:hypothetical protein
MQFTPPDQMSADERLSEVSALLATGLLRLKARRNSNKSPDPRESCLDFHPRQSEVSRRQNS